MNCFEKSCSFEFVSTETLSFSGIEKLHREPTSILKNSDYFENEIYFCYLQLALDGTRMNLKRKE